jgi:carbon monoxide dehydrogenase subunit G
MPRIEGVERLELSCAEAFARLDNPAILAGCIPGCGPLQPKPDGSYAASISVVVGPVRGSYQGTVRYTEREPPSRITISVDGTGAHGAISGTGALQLHEDGGGCRVTYEGSFDVRGRVASVGARLLTGVARKMIVETLRRIEQAPAAASPG